MENLRKKFEGMIQQNDGEDSSDKRLKHRSPNIIGKPKDEASQQQFLPHPRKSPKAKKQTLNLPFLLGNLPQEDDWKSPNVGITLKSPDRERVARNTASPTETATVDELSEEFASETQSGNNSSMLKNIRKYVNNIRSPRKSRGSVEELALDPFLRKTRGRSLLQLEVIGPDEQESVGTSTDESKTHDLETMFSFDEDSASARNRVKPTSSKHETLQNILQHSPQPAPRLKINRQETAPKPAPRKIPIDVTAGEVSAVETRKSGINRDSPKHEESQRFEKSPRKSSTSGFTLTSGLKRHSRKFHEGLLDVLQSDEASRESRNISQEEMEERESKKKEEKLKRQEDKRQQEEDAKIAEMIKELEKKEMKEEEENGFELQIQGAFVVCGEEVPQESKGQPKSPRKALKEVKRRISTIRRTKKSRISDRAATPATSPVRPLSDVINGELSGSRRKSSGNYKNTLSKVKRAMSMKVTSSAHRRRTPNFTDGFTSSEGESWHVDDGAVLNLSTRRARKSRNESAGKTPEKSKTLGFNNKTMTAGMFSGNGEVKAKPAVLQDKMSFAKSRKRISKTVGFRQSFVRDDWDKITDFGGMKDRRAMSTAVESDSHLYEEIEESTIRALSWDNAFELQSPAPPENLNGMQEYQFIDEVFADIKDEAERCGMDSDFSDSESEKPGSDVDNSAIDNEGEGRPRLYSNMQGLKAEGEGNKNESDAEFDAVSILTVRENDDFYDQVPDELQGPKNASLSNTTSTATVVAAEDGDAQTLEGEKKLKSPGVQSTKKWFKSRDLVKRIFDKPSASTPEDEYVVMQKNDLLIASTEIRAEKSPTVQEEEDRPKEEEEPASVDVNPTGVGVEVKSATEDKKDSEEKTPKRLAGLLSKFRFSPKSTKSYDLVSAEKKQKKSDSKSSTPKRAEDSKKEKRKTKKSKKSKARKSDFSSGQYLAVPDTGLPHSSDDFSFSDESASVGNSNQQSPDKQVISENTSPAVKTPLAAMDPKNATETGIPSADFLVQLGVALRKTSGHAQRSCDPPESDGLERVRNFEVKGSRITSDIVIYDIPNSPAVKKVQEVHVDTPIPSPMHATTAAGERRQTLEISRRKFADQREEEGRSGCTDVDLPIYDVLESGSRVEGVVGSVGSDVTLTRRSELASVSDVDAIYDETPDEVFRDSEERSENDTPRAGAFHPSSQVSVDYAANKETNNQLSYCTQSNKDDAEGQHGEEIYDEPPVDLASQIKQPPAENRNEIYDEPPNVGVTSRKGFPLVENVDEIYDQPPADEQPPNSAENSDQGIEIYDIPPEELSNKEEPNQSDLGGLIYDAPPAEDTGSGFTSDEASTSAADAIYDEPPDEFSSNTNNRALAQGQQAAKMLDAALTSSPRPFVSPSLRFIAGSPQNALSPSLMYKKVEKKATTAGLAGNEPDYEDIDESDEEEDEDDDYVDVARIPSHSGATPRRPPAVFTFPDYDVLKRSPTSVERNEFVEYMKVLEIEHGQCALSTPYISVNRTPGRTIDQSGDIYVSDCHGDCMDIYSYKGTHKSSINLPGNPRGLASYTSRHVLCASSSRGEICVVDTVKGAIVRKLGRAAQLRNPRCVVMHPSNQTFVTSDIRQLRKWKVLLFDIRTGSPGNTIAAAQDTKIGWPEFLAFKHGSETEIYASDSEGHAVMCYDFRNAAVPTMTIGRRGHQNGEFISPCGVAHVPGGQITLNSAPGGSLLVADWGNNRVSAFDATSGAFQCHVINEDEEDLRNPFDLKVDTCGGIYLTESGSNNIKVFHPI